MDYGQYLFFADFGMLLNIIYDMERFLKTGYKIRKKLCYNVFILSCRA